MSWFPRLAVNQHNTISASKVLKQLAATDFRHLERNADQGVPVHTLGFSACIGLSAHAEALHVAENSYSSNVVRRDGHET